MYHSKSRLMKIRFQIVHFSKGQATTIAKMTVPTNLKIGPFKIQTVLFGFQTDFEKMETICSNFKCLVSGFQIPFKFWTICKSTSWVFKITSRFTICHEVFKNWSMFGIVHKKLKSFTKVNVLISGTNRRNKRRRKSFESRTSFCRPHWRLRWSSHRWLNNFGHERTIPDVHQPSRISASLETRQRRHEVDRKRSKSRLRFRRTLEQICWNEKLFRQNCPKFKEWCSNNSIVEIEP